MTVEVATAEHGLTLSDYQRRICEVPETLDLALTGGRGSGKNWGAGVLVLRHCEQYGPRARVLWIRQSFPALADAELMLHDIFGLAYGGAARYNGQSHIWRLPNGSYVELGILAAAKDFQRFQGRSFSMLVIDEAGHFASPELLDRLRSNLRGPKGMPLRVIITANPCDPGHFWLAKRYAMKPAWVPFKDPDTGSMFVNCPGTYLDNPFIDRDAYRRQLERACPNDDELLRAWVHGDWSVSRGAFFAGVLSATRNAIDPWPTDWRRLRPTEPGMEQWDPVYRHEYFRDWRMYLSHDYGSSAPSVTFVCCESPGAVGPDERYYPKGSIILLDELATSDPDDLTQGLRWTVNRLAEAIKELARRWGMPPRGVADDAIFNFIGSGVGGSIAAEFRACGVYFNPAKKADRRTGWEVMRRMLADAGEPDRPGLFISRNCGYFWSTAPYLARDPRRPDDVDSRGADHGVDSARYACLRQRHTIDSEQFFL